MHYVYVLSKESKNYYIGYTGSLKDRFEQHQNLHPGYKLIYYEAYPLEKDARERERKLKHYGSAWRALRQRLNA